MDEFEGWAADPTGAHDARYYLDGRPTPLVRDGDVETFDVLPAPPPAPPRTGAPASAAAAPAAPSDPPAGGPPPSPPGVGSYWAPPQPPAAPAPVAEVAAWASPASGVPGAAADSFGVGTAVAPGRRRRFAAVGAVAAVLVIVTGLVVALSGGKDAEAVVVGAVTSTMADRTAHITMTGTTSVGSDHVTIVGTGAIDFGRNAMAITASSEVAGAPAQVRVDYVGGTVYESIPGLDQVVPGKSWVSIDLSSLSRVGAQDPDALGAGSNPTAILRVLGEEGNTVVPLGPSTVDGVSVQGYAVTIDPSAIKQRLAHASLPSWMQSLLSKVDFRTASVKVYVDGNGQLRRYTTVMSESVGSAGPVTMDVSMDLTDYGAPVTVTAPPADQVMSLQQLLQMAASQMGGAPS